MKCFMNQTQYYTTALFSCHLNPNRMGNFNQIFFISLDDNIKQRLSFLSQLTEKNVSDFGFSGEQW